MKPDEAVLHVLSTLADVLFFFSISCLHFRRHKKETDPPTFRWIMVGLYNSGILIKMPYEIISEDNWVGNVSSSTLNNFDKHLWRDFLTKQPR